MSLSLWNSSVFCSIVRNLSECGFPVCGIGQKENGALPCIVPTGGWGYGWGSGPSWDSVIAFTPYMLYRYTGHKEILEENADGDL